MNVKLITIFLFSYLYGFFEMFIGFKQKKGLIVKSGDKMSLWILIFCIVLGYSISFSVAATRTGRIYHWNTFFIIGLTLALVGLIIRINSILTLKKHFTYTITRIDNHELIDIGLYKLIRHPGYLGQMIIFAGISTMLSNWLSIILMMIPVTIGYLYRIAIEEKFLINQFGQKYIDYQKRTKRLIPFIV